VKVKSGRKGHGPEFQSGVPMSYGAACSDRHEPLLHFPLRYWMPSSKALIAQIHTIIRTTISQYYVNQAIKRGVAQWQVQPGSMTFTQ
jgi:hypothetical protein